jgi:murein DD-endopeptidase MepM/ murein hydrolase activator NlpD
LQKPTGGEPRPDDAPSTDRDQAAAPSPLLRLTNRATRAVTTRARSRAAAAGAASSAALRPFTSAERALPIAVASIVAVAALLAFLPGSPQGAANGVAGSTPQPRIAVGGADRGDADPAGSRTKEPPAALVDGGATFLPLVLPQGIANVPSSEQASAEPDPGSNPAAVVAPSSTPTPETAVTDDGTLLTGYAPETDVEDGAYLIRSYTVHKGDTLASVAKTFGVSSMTLWWANKLKKQQLKPGQELRIPPVSGLVYTVKDTDTLDTVAAKFKVGSSKIVELNGLEDPTLVVGQVLILPGAKGAPMPTPKPVFRSTGPSVIASGGSVLGGGPAVYPGGPMHWPVIGGNNYISQYYHYGHWAIDIAATYGSKVVAAAPGKVIFAGWKSNGGGYQVWISHGSNIYTTYNHMSAITVSNGASVGRGAQVGRIGATGDATGPHLHFEVWNGHIWDGGQRVNPLKYF